MAPRHLPYHKPPSHLLTSRVATPGAPIPSAPWQPARAAAGAATAAQPSLTARITPRGLTANLRVPFSTAPHIRSLLAGAATGAFVVYHHRPEGEGFCQEVPVSVAKLHDVFCRAVLPWVEREIMDRIWKGSSFATVGYQAGELVAEDPADSGKSRILSEIAFLNHLGKLARSVGCGSRTLARIQLAKEAELGGVPGADGIGRDQAALQRIELLVSELRGAPPKTDDDATIQPSLRERLSLFTQLQRQHFQECASESASKVRLSMADLEAVKFLHGTFSEIVPDVFDRLPNVSQNEMWLNTRDTTQEVFSGVVDKTQQVRVQLSERAHEAAEHSHSILEVYGKMYADASATLLSKIPSGILPNTNSEGNLSMPAEKDGSAVLKQMKLTETELVHALRALEGLPRNAQHAKLLSEIEREYDVRVQDVRNFSDSQAHVVFRSEMEDRFRRARQDHWQFDTLEGYRSRLQNEMEVLRKAEKETADSDFGWVSEHRRALLFASLASCLVGARWYYVGVDGMRNDAVEIYSGVDSCARGAGRRIENNLHIVDHTKTYVVEPVNNYVVQPVNSCVAPVLDHLQDDFKNIHDRAKDLKLPALKDLGESAWNRLPGLGAALDSWRSSAGSSEASDGPVAASGASSHSGASAGSGWVKIEDPSAGGRFFGFRRRG